MKAIFALIAAIVLATVPPIGASLAAQEHLNTIEKQCGIQLKMPPKACECISAKAASLSDSQQAFVVAMVTKNKSEAASIKAKLSVEEQVQTGKFMTSAPSQCAKQ